VIIVDDKLALEALGGRLDPSTPEPVATTWCFHYRLMRALRDETRWGALSGSVTTEARRVAADPPESRLRVLNPRLITDAAADLAVQYDLNLLAAELLAAARRHRAVVRLSAPNVGRRWPEVMAAEGIALVVV